MPAAGQPARKRSSGRSSEKNNHTWRNAMADASHGKSYRTYPAALGALLLVSSAVPAAAAWEPTRPVEFIVPAGTGGGADQMARTIQGIIAKHGLMKQSMVVINKAGGAGGEGFLDVKGSRGNPHKLV